MDTDTFPSNDTRPTARVLLLTGILRGLWDFEPADDLCDKDIVLPDQSLVKSLTTQPSIFSNEVVECLHELARLQLTPRRRVFHAPTPTNLSLTTPWGAPLGMALTSAYAISGLSQKENSAPLFTDLLASSNFPSLHSPSPILSPADLILHRWSWCDIDSGAPLLIPLESRILDYQRLAAQTHRDTNSATRLHPPRGGKTSLFALLLKCLRWRVSPQKPEGTTNVYCMNAIGL